MIETSPFFNFVVLVLKCRAIDQVWTLLLDALGEAGFDRVLYVSTRFLPEDTRDITPDALILTNHHQDMVDVFVGAELYKHTPTGAWSSDVARSISWQAIEDRFSANDLSDSELKMRRLSRRLGVLAGYTMMLESADARSRAVAGLCAGKELNQLQVDKIWLDQGDEIMAMVNLAHLKMSSLPQTGQRRPLTTRQREVLLLVSDGMTVPEVAAKMGLTVSAVEKILRMTRQALGVRSTAEAVKRATVFNLFSEMGRGRAV